MRLKIRHKLFFTLLLTSVVVATGLYFFLQWSFDRGFLNYVRSQEKEQLDRLASLLTDSYEQHGSWRFLEGNFPLWMSLVAGADPFLRRLHSEGLQPPEPRMPPLPPRDQGSFDRSPPPPRELRIMGPRVILFDRNKNRIIGGPGGPGGPMGGTENVFMQPFLYKGDIVGYLGLVPLMELSYAGDLLFVEQQKESFTLVTLIMVVCSLLLAYPLTSHLLRPIKALTAGTNTLIAGAFRTRISVSSGDELGRLSEHFNILAMTLEKNEQARRQWVADISHELRTPLAVLRGEVEAMQDGIRKPEPRALDGLHGEIMHLERLVNDLYELSMSDIGALNYRKTMVDPIGILQGALEGYEQRFAGKHMGLQAEFALGCGCTLLGDPDRLQQLFINLLENSLRYTDEPGKLKVLAETCREELKITFQDSGPGVSEEQLPRLFDRFYRTDISRNRQRGGAGLGLSICRNIVEAHQGTIKAHHSPEGGLQIVITLPLIS